MGQTAPQWATLLGFAVPLFIAGASGVWAVWVRAQENQRAEWRRMEELIQIIYDGPKNGLWAQKIAVDELASIAKRRPNINQILRDAESYFRENYPERPSLPEHISAALKGRS